jgi:hypothetical protein
MIARYIKRIVSQREFLPTISSRLEMNRKIGIDNRLFSNSLNIRYAFSERKKK